MVMYPPWAAAPATEPQQSLWYMRDHQSIAIDGIQVHFPLPDIKIHVTRASGEFQA